MARHCHGLNKFPIPFHSLPDRVLSSVLWLDGKRALKTGQIGHRRAGSEGRGGGRGCQSLTDYLWGVTVDDGPGMESPGFPKSPTT